MLSTNANCNEPAPHVRIETNATTSNQVNHHTRGVYLRTPWQLQRPIRLQLAALSPVLRAIAQPRHRRVRCPLAGTAHAAICPAVLDGDMAVIWQDATPILAHFHRNTGRLWAARRLLLCAAAAAADTPRSFSFGDDLPLLPCTP